MKKSFTLIELLLSIAIFSILVLAMSNVIKEVNNSKDFLIKHYKNKKDYLVKVLYYDILDASEIKIIHTKNPDYDKLILKTSNSLYKLINPAVTWYVTKKALIRKENLKYTIDKFDSNMKIFKIYKNKSKFFIYIDGKRKIFFELMV